MDQLDTLPYKTFNDLKSRYPVKAVVVDVDMLSRTNTFIAFKTHREYVAHLFKQEGVEITRWSHNYKTLGGQHPELGVVYLANDSVVMPKLEAHVLIGHNARYINV
jgi:hypothetical protein